MNAEIVQPAHILTERGRLALATPFDLEVGGMTHLNTPDVRASADQSPSTRPIEVIQDTPQSRVAIRFALQLRCVRLPILQQLRALAAQLPQIVAPEGHAGAVGFKLSVPVLFHPEVVTLLCRDEHQKMLQIPPERLFR